jgi:DNA end-binding protein Ku
MARAIWSGSISFGLLNVPVKLYSAVSKQTVRFRELREGDGSRIRHKRVAEDDGEEVPYDNIVKGYEITPDQYVIVSRDELDEIAPEKTRAVEIQDFVDLDEIDPIYFEHPYYLGPDKGAERAYQLLVNAMAEQRKVAIARFVLRNKEHLAAIRPMDGVLTMATMRFADEVVSPDDLDDVLPEKQAKVEPKPTKAPDLMAALEESLAAVSSEELGGDGKAEKPSGAGRKSKAKASSGGSKSRSGSKSKSGSSRSRSKAKAAK